MTASEVLAGYEVRLQELVVGASRARSARLWAIVYIGVAVALALVLAAIALSRRSLPLWESVLPIPIALYSARESRKHGSSLNRLLRLKRFYEAGVDRLQDDWAGKGISGDQFKQDHHPYQNDLNLFGKGSLFELLCTCRTEIGRKSLARSLLDRSATDLQELQEAVRELQSRVELREQLGALGDYSFQDSNPNTFAEWLALPHTPARTWLSAVLLITSLSTALPLLFLGGTFLWTYLSFVIASLLAVHLGVGALYVPDR